MEQKKNPAGIILLVLIIIALGGLVAWRVLHKPPAGVSIEKIEEEEGMAVAVETPVRRDFTEYVTCDARIDTANRYMLRVSTPGMVEKVNVKVGDSVRKDQVLLEFRKTELEAQVSAARAAHREAVDNLKRYTVLLEKGGASQNRVDAQKTALERAAAALRLAESALSFAEIRSPVGGDIRVEARFAEPGEEKGAGKELLSLVDMTALEVKANVPESAMRLIREGFVAEYRLEGEHDWRTGTIARISPSTNHPNRFFDVFLRVKNEKTGVEWVMRPGMYAQVRIPVRRHTNSIAVSAGSVKRNGGSEYLFVVDRSAEGGPRAKRTDVRTGFRQEGYVQITKGPVDEKSDVVSTPRDDLKDGDRVRPEGA